MGAAIAVTVLVCVGAGAVGVAAARRLGARMGIDVNRNQRRVWLTLLVALLPSAVVIWLFAAGHGAIAVGVLVVVFIVPEFVLVPLRIKRSRRAAEASRARREAARAADSGPPAEH